MTEYLYPALFALFVWWASTVLIIYLDGLPRWTFKYSMIGATVIFAISLIGLYHSAQDATITGAYLAFTWDGDVTDTMLDTLTSIGAIPDDAGFPSKLKADMAKRGYVLVTYHGS